MSRLSQADLQKDMQMRLHKSKESEELQRKREAAVRAKQLEEKQKKENDRQQWLSFYNGKGFDKYMYCTWDFGRLFFLSPQDPDKHPNQRYNYVWSSPEYGGTNEIYPFEGTIMDFFRPNYGRDKGCKLIRTFCQSCDIYEGSKIIIPAGQRAVYVNRLCQRNNGIKMSDKQA